MVLSRTKIISIAFMAIVLSRCTSSVQEDSNLLGNDVRLFNSTPVWEMAKAIEKNDTLSLRALLKEQPKSILNYQEKKFGQSLLNWSVYASHYPAVKVLAELGADPNLKAKDSTSAFINAANHYESTDYLKTLLIYGGDVNAAADIDAPQHHRTPLMASAKSLENVKILINAGANPNFVYNKNGEMQSALVYAFYSDNIDIIKYLIMDVGVDCKHATGVTITGDSLYVTNDLRLLPYPLKSIEYKKKMEVVAFLKKQGIDYLKAPIPAHYLKIYDKDYLEKY